MDPKLNEVSQIFDRFKASLVRNDLETCSKLLSQLKILLIEFKSLPPLFADTPNAVQELSIARDIYEHAVVLSVKMEDQDAFERDFFQLKPYYTDASGRLTQSPQEYPILGLNLLRLLVQNRIAEFHTELELLSANALENPCIKHAVELEQSFMEGAYNRVLTARQTVPHETYVYFMDLLARTVRDEIAGCSEKAYDSLTVKDARQMLLLNSDQELFEYIQEEHPEWEVKNGLVVFQKAKDSAPCKEIPSLQLINQTLSYARELEQLCEHHCGIFLNAFTGLKSRFQDLRNIRSQLYSAAEFFEDTYHKSDHDQLLLESLKDYVSKAIISTIDHLGSVTSKVNTFLDENIDEAYETNVRVSCLEQRLKTCQKYSNHEGLSQQSLVIQIPKYHKQYLLPEGRFSEAVKAENTKTESSGLRRGHNEQASREFPTRLVAFSFAQTAPNKGIEKRTRSLSPSRFRIKRSGSVSNPSASPIFPVAHSGSLIRLSISPNTQQHSLYPGREKRKDIEVYSKKTRNLFKAFLSIHKYKNDSSPYRTIDR